MNLYPFSPAYGSSQAKTADTTAANATIAAQNKQVRILNKGTNPVWVRTYPSSQTVAATTADCLIQASTATVNAPAVILTKDETHDRISYISTGGTSVIEIMTGEGF